MESRRSKAMAAQKNGRRSNQERKMALIQDEQSRSGCTRTEKARHWRWISWDVLLTYCSRMQTLHPWCFCVFHFLTWHHINSTISFIEENNAGNAAAALMARLAPKAKSGSISSQYLTALLMAAPLALGDVEIEIIDKHFDHA
ncbi:hypothetical protein AHAS_Ahas04G0037600 [Arachis hypogaea]